MSDHRPTRKTYSEAMNEWAAREGRASFSDRSRVSTLVPDPFAHPVVRLLGYGWRFGLLVLLGLGVYWYLFRSHLASEAFAQRLADHARAALGAETAKLSRLEWHGGQAGARQFSATGGPGSFFRSIEASEVSFHVPFSTYWEPEWRLNRVEAGSVQVEFRSGGLNVAKPAEEPDLEAVPDSFSPPVLTAPGESLKLDATAPDPSLAPEAKGRDKRVLDLDLRKDGFDVAPPVRSLSFGGLEAARFGAGWGMTETTRGELRDASILAGRERDGAWMIEIPSGTLNQNWLRGLKLTNFRARYADGVLALENTPVQLGGGTATLGGRIRCAETPVFELALQVENLPLETFCGDPFDRFFSLQASGTLNIGGSTNLSSGITVAGTLQATGGSIRGLPIQHALASATTRIRFREFDITSGTIEIATGGGRLEVKSFTLASRTDVTVRGRFTHDASGFAGELEIGADQALLQKLSPAVSVRFFPKSQGGKRWMSVPLEGAEYDRLTSTLAREFTAAHEAAGKP
jgi:hypothetical protein